MEEPRSAVLSPERPEEEPRAASPKAYRNVAAGRHVFRVAARDADGDLDLTPAVRGWRVVPRG
ncbi:MAG TPA: hypothetical protein VG709_05400 [Actinomycetota bacterium]|nr:hypothetical protein [Actinomycetota bacterium]